ncbi:MAG: SdrD B-like domain-containing protein, partial [Christensenellales bacterium]
VETATVGGRAWQDQNADGVMDAQEPALSGVTVALLDENGGVAAEQTVGEDGRYSFRLIRSGCYSLRFTLPGGELFADQSGEAGGSCVAPVEGSTAATAPMTLEGGQKIDSLNLGAIEAAQIGDTVWLDKNGNGLQDYGEPGLAGVALTLLRVGGDGQADIAAQTVSDEYGYYHFRNLRPGSYSLRVELEAGDTLTFRFGAPLGEIDSDIDPETGVSDVFRLQSGETRLNIDVGLTERAEK